METMVTENIENIDISVNDLCERVSDLTKVPENEVKVILDSFINLFLKRFKL